MSDEHLVTIEEMAKQLGIAVITVRKYYRTKIIPGYKIGAKILRFDPKEVREALRQERYRKKHKQ
jgi:excisionase family DNA binding protein